MAKVALVTGGASGIGRAACLKFAELGIAVVVADVDEAGGKRTAEEVSAAFSAAGGTHTNPKSTFVRTDVSKEEDVKHLMEHIRNTLDYCMNNAGIEGVGAPTADQPTDSFEQVIRVNAHGVFLCLKHQIPLMLETAEGQGAIVITSSVAGVIGYPGMAAYAASKHAVVGMMRCAAAEYGPQGLRVNCINPGATDTPLLSRLASSMPGDAASNLAAVAASYPLRRLATPEEIAEAAVWACTKATCMTGHTLVLDGGASCT